MSLPMAKNLASFSGEGGARRVWTQETLSNSSLTLPVASFR